MKLKSLAAMAAMLLTSIALTSFSPCAGAQVEQGQFVGRITDPSGAAIAGAVVNAQNVDTNILQKATTNETGEYVITPVLAGNYVLTVEAVGFAKAATKHTEVQVGQTVREALPLSIGT